MFSLRRQTEQNMERNDIYKCETCGNIVSGRHPGNGELACCGKPMRRMLENTVDAAQEKHVPVAELTEKGLLVKVGSVAHPMEEKHYIEWIEVIAGDRSMMRYLSPGDAPEALFNCGGDCPAGTAPVIREYCNLHGLWSTQTITKK